MPIILVPGIKGSVLVDTYPPRFKVRFSLEDMVIGNIFEDPLDFALRDGLYDENDQHLFREWELINFAYKRMLERLRSWVDPRCYTFPYDWRKPIETNAVKLNQLIDHIRGKLARGGKPPKIHLVTHSMGGLVLRSALSLRKPEPFDGVGRIVFIAPPFQGSCDIAKVLVAGEKDGLFGDQKDFRKLARTMPSVYQMVPSYDRAAVDERGRHLDLFELDNWQANLTEQDKLEPRFLADALAFRLGKRKYREGVSSAPMLDDAGLRRHAKDVLVLMSAGHETLDQIRVLTANEPNRNWFDFDGSRSTEHGDGRVPMVSAAVEGVTLAAYRGASSHGVTCRDDLIINSTSMWLEGRRLIKMKPRTARNSVERPSRTTFEPWNGKIDELEDHVV